MKPLPMASDKNSTFTLTGNHSHIPKIHIKYPYISEAVPKLQFWNSNLKIRSFARLKA
jgi:hypothetical protein